MMPKLSLQEQRAPVATSEQQATLLRLAGASEEHPIALGRYDVVGLLGQGGMGTVYTAVDRNNGVRVALKTIRGVEEQEAQNLKREFRIVADLVHDNLVPVYELGHEDALWFFTMELVDGLSFEKWARGKSADSSSQSTSGDTQTSTTQDATSEHLQDEPPSPPLEHSAEKTCKVDASPPSATRSRPSAPARSASELHEAFRQVALGVKALHEIGLRHGDIKPSNILVRPSGRVVIVDFGVSENFQGTEPGTEGLRGTPSFMAPEQLKGLPAGPAADWFAVGTMFYRTLTGIAPYSLEGTLVPPNHLVPISPHLSELCVSLLNPVAAERLDGPRLLARLAAPDEESQSGSTPVIRPAYVGRECEFETLRTACTKAMQKTLTVTFVHGPSGIGKSSLVKNFLAGVDAKIPMVFSGRCYERESVPYKAFDRIVDALARWLQSFGEDSAGFLPDWTAELTCIFPALLSVPAMAKKAEGRFVELDPKEIRRRALIAFAELLATLSKTTPLVLSIDDLQWADRDSADLLDSLLTTAPHASILIIAGFRKEEADANEALSGLFRRCHDESLVVDLPITALNAHDTERITKALLAGSPQAFSDELVSHIAQESSGIPFLVEELVRFSLAHQEKPEALSLKDVIATRMHALSAEQRLLLEMAAVAERPTPQPVLFDAASLDPSEMRALLSLRQASLIRWTGPDTEAPVTTYHDSIREAVLGIIGAERLPKHHERLAQALLRHHRTEETDAGLFEVVRHLNAGRQAILSEALRQQAAELNLRAGKRARETGAFQLAHQCFESGIAFLNDAAWRDHYDLALALHNGAVEAAYLDLDYKGMTLRAKDVKAHGRSILDQMPTWEAEINLHIGQQAYAEAIDIGAVVLHRLGIKFKSNPEPADFNLAFEEVMNTLGQIGPDGLLALPEMHDPQTEAVMSVLVKLCACVYYARPLLLPIFAGHLISASVHKGLSTATPYALTIVGVLLNSVGKYAEAHGWGQLALQLLERQEGSPLEACTKHVVHCLVCVWTVPLESTVDDVRSVVEVARHTGDYEYAAYAAYGSVYGRLYASRPLGPLLEDAVALSEMMRGLGSVNALHTHLPFVQLLRCLRGDSEEPGSLDGHGFTEKSEVAAAKALGSRHGILSLRLTMGLARFYSGEMALAREQFDLGRGYLDPTTSLWHVPIFHQFSALAICQSWSSIATTEQAAYRAHIEDSLSMLSELAAAAPVNFSHRVDLIEGALLAIDGDSRTALLKYDAAAAGAAKGGWLNDEALAQELAANSEATIEARQIRLRAAAAAYEAWGAAAKVAHVLKRLD